MNQMLEVQLVFFRRAGREDNVDDVIADFFIDVNAIDQLAGAHDFIQRNHRLDFHLRDSEGHFVQNQPLFVKGRVADEHLEHEAIDLRLRQRIGSFLVDRVLRRQNQERRRQRHGFSAKSHLTLLHRFQQRRLHLGRGAIDFIGQH